MKISTPKSALFNPQSFSSMARDTSASAPRLPIFIKKFTSETELDPSNASKMEIRAFHDNNKNKLRQKMRTLRCKVLNYALENHKIEPGHAVYRKNQLEKFDAKREVNFRRLSQKRTDMTRGLRRKFCMSQPHINERNSWVGDKSAELCLSNTPNQYLKKVDKIHELCKILTKEEIELICDDPRYFFSQNGEIPDDSMLDQRKWDREAGYEPLYIPNKRKKKKLPYFTKESKVSIESVSLRPVETAQSAITRLQLPKTEKSDLDHNIFTDKQSSQRKTKDLLSVYQEQEQSTRDHLDNRDKRLKQISLMVAEKQQLRLARHKKLKEKFDKEYEKKIQKKKDRFDRKMDRNEYKKELIEYSKIITQRMRKKRDQELIEKVRYNQQKMAEKKYLRDMNEKIKLECLRLRGERKRKKMEKELNELKAQRRSRIQNRLSFIQPGKRGRRP